VQEVEELKPSVALDLEEILSCSKIKYFSNQSSRATSTPLILDPQMMTREISL
jgi:hypothetical protein